MNQKEFTESFDCLKGQQKNVLLMLLDGKTDKEMAESLSIEPGTVRKNIQNLCDRFEIDSEKFLPDQRDTKRRNKLIALCKKYNLVNSDFYIEREPYESQCYQEILKPGALVRIKAPEQMGKTSLLSKVLSKAREQNHQTITLDFQLADSTVLTDIRKFLQWICANASDILELPDRVDESWQDTLGENRNCTRYFQRYLLKEIHTPLVVGLDNVDLVFEQAAIVNDFCNLLRGWHVQAMESDRIGETWKKMRLVVVHSTEVYRTMDINSSPLANVGITFDLPEFNPEQVQDLARKYGLNLDRDKIVQLMTMLGGHPALVRTAFDCLKRQNISIEQLLKTAPTEEGAFSHYLRKHLQNLRQHPELVEAFSLCVASPEPIELKSEFTFKLHRMGLVNLQGNSVTPRCELYRQYFHQRLNQ